MLVCSKPYGPMRATGRSHVPSAPVTAASLVRAALSRGRIAGWISSSRIGCGSAPFTMGSKLSCQEQTHDDNDCLNAKTAPCEGLFSCRAAETTRRLCNRRLTSPRRMLIGPTPKHRLVPPHQHEVGQHIVGR